MFRLKSTLTPLLTTLSSRFCSSTTKTPSYALAKKSQSVSNDYINDDEKLLYRIESSLIRNLDKNYRDQKFEYTNDNHLYLTFEDKSIFVLGTFHFDRNSVYETMNIIQSYKPDMVLLELCPWRGQKLLKYLVNWPFHLVPKDVESASFMTTKKLGISTKCIDLPEHIIIQLLEKYDNKIANELKLNAQFHPPLFGYNSIKNDYQLSDDSDSDSSDGEYIFFDHENDDLYSREGLRKLMHDNNYLLKPIVFDILYTEREKHIIKQIIKAEANKIILVCGMAHLDGIERLWSDAQFWNDEQFWMMGHEINKTFFVKMYQKFYKTFAGFGRGFA